MPGAFSSVGKKFGSVMASIAVVGLVPDFVVWLLLAEDGCAGSVDFGASW